MTAPAEPGTMPPRPPLYRFVEDVGPPERTLVLANASAPDPVRRMLAGLFERQPTAFDERSLPDVDSDTVVLFEGGDVVATSPLSALEDAVLMVNSDLFKTGTRPLEEIAMPDVLAHLDDVPFRVRGYPESHKEKLLLILVSRHIERAAWERGEGRLRASFQHLSRITDERGTREVYERLARSGVDVHLYGMPDWRPPVDFPVTVHGGYKSDFRESWFVVYRPPSSDGEGDSVALVAVETSPNEWEGFWTSRPDVVREVNRHVERTL